jgi:hypothetical protein
LVAEETKIIPDFYFQTAVTFLESLLAASPFQMINQQGPAQGISTGANRDQYILLKSGADLETNFMRQKKAKSRIKPGKSSNVLTNANSHVDHPHRIKPGKGLECPLFAKQSHCNPTIHGAMCQSSKV